jgi:lysophospholipase L1-like esterase
VAPWSQRWGPFVLVDAILTPIREPPLLSSQVQQGLGHLLEAAVEALRAIHVHAMNANVRMLVVLLPTKESVFWPRVRTPVPGLSRLAEDEARLRAELVAALAAENIPYVDVLPSLRTAAAQTYFENIDGHPNAEGHRVIAEAVRAQW